MKRFRGQGTRRSVLKMVGAAAAFGSVMGASAGAADTHPPVNVVINQSPWLAGFAAIADYYEEDTGNQVTLDVNPYAGSLEKQRNAVRSAESEYDLLIINGIFYPEMYHGGFLEPLQNIRADFDLDSQVYEYGGTPWFNADTKSIGKDAGDLLTVPVNPNITLLFYRKDIYEENGWSAPTTFEEMASNARTLHNPKKFYGIAQRAGRATVSITWDFLPYIEGHGGSYFRDSDGGDYFVTINSEAGRTALETYVGLAKELGPENSANLTQGDLIQLLVTGKLLHTVLPAAAWAQMDDPNKSAVVGKIGYATLPAAEGFASTPALGHWLGGIPKNIPDANKQAALAFLDWFQKPETQIKYAELGGAPVSAAAYESDFADLPENRYMQAMRVAAPLAKGMWTIPEGAELASVMELGLNRAVAGEISVVDTLNAMAADLEKVLADAGYETGRLPDLK
ncbi:extracellular solute-binding protein [Pelagimonas varians]|uniref:Putative ABC transporter-binding protein n=1 Tax=Pelagimonas varians TaxID=696760 RepID=A0A238KSJ1_9RHOB|nr:extracellular solute-binding protein [Pelagimonas varians]PYG32520.1 multiple sugar transport system substrate-binding protein [Pelagimonas varians]SMX45785.1 putative ABC transporter-binding protein precursor [Pelagimonas varians]